MNFVEVAVGFLTAERCTVYLFTGATVVLEFLVAKAQTDGVEDWHDKFYARMLKKVSKSRFNALKGG